MTIRERQQMLEREYLSEYACCAADSKGRKRPEPQCDIRTVFSRDRDRIIHSKSFRRLKQKTQVFLSPEGDHYRTRLTHTLEVSQIARTLARAMRLNEDLTEAIAMGHDLGHTPFGHAGERALNSLSSVGFRHYEQSVRVAERIEKERRGLNLTVETLDGILNHTSGAEAGTLEGQIVRHADRIAYLNHDIEDAITAEVFSEPMLPKEITDVLGNGKSPRITALINDLIAHSADGVLRFGAPVKAAYDRLYDYMFEHVYLNTESGVKSEEHKVYDLIALLFEHYQSHPDAMPDLYRAIAEEESAERAAVDYISGMSDAYATYCFERLFVPRPWMFRG